MKLSKEEVEHIANLARIELSEAEIKKFSQQLTEVLDYVDQLEKVDTKTVGIDLRSDLTNVTGEDVIKPFSDPDGLKKSFPESQDSHLRVKGVL
ncbi:MAG: Asp-tRNA(Asn)/Glu-tRNA(Gln) amidotransferase subunit GatC [Patescibacteria group bacterium]